MTPKSVRLDRVYSLWPACCKGKEAVQGGHLHIAHVQELCVQRSGLARRNQHDVVIRDGEEHTAGEQERTPSSQGYGCALTSLFKKMLSTFETQAPYFWTAGRPTSCTKVSCRPLFQPGCELLHLSVKAPPFFFTIAD